MQLPEDALLGLKMVKEIQEVTASLPAEEISADAEVAAILSEMDGIFALKEQNIGTKRFPLNWLWQAFSWTNVAP